jgi:hypothetical protein
MLIVDMPRSIGCALPDIFAREFQTAADRAETEAGGCREKLLAADWDSERVWVDLGGEG